MVQLLIYVVQGLIDHDKKYIEDEDHHDVLQLYGDDFFIVIPATLRYTILVFEIQLVIDPGCYLARSRFALVASHRIPGINGTLSLLSGLCISHDGSKKVHNAALWIMTGGTTS